MESRIPTFGREAPPHVLAGLRTLDPSAELVWIERDRWLLGQYAPESRRALEKAGHQLRLSTWRSIAARNGVITHTDRVRLRMAELKLNCFRFTTEYYIALPDSAVVHDQRVMDWMYKHLSDNAIDSALNEDYERELAAARDDLTDTERARAAYKYLFTLSHYLGKQTIDSGPRSGWTRHHWKDGTFAGHTHTSGVAVSAPKIVH